MAEIKLTDTQKSVLERLRKKHHTFLADATAQHWLRGESYYMDTRVNVSQQLRTAFNKANKQAVEARAND